ncbi:MAG: bifunctional phosphoribosylaminoimidazolecarboxamide formyltransferase/IMP cyclohydrolase [Myxococcales bacterium]|nr:bifunctional phosphoribosylaminoimidazolecarboxamide formyltransferase/IMP cyclohydrolase [Myxococcales bacterium]
MAAEQSSAVNLGGGDVTTSTGEDRRPVRRAVLSVSNKDGLAELASALVEVGAELVSSGGTASRIAEAGLSVTKVSDYTGAPEILDGRVKTLHPRIFAGILARDTDDHNAQLQAQDVPPVDLVVVNLYPFEATIARADVTLDEAVEQVDIGGPSLVRAAAKNHERVAVVVDPADYARVIAAVKAGGIDGALRRELAAKAFAHTAGYDAAISRWFAANIAPAEAAEAALPERITLELTRRQSLRYGENPHQAGAFYALPPAFGGDEAFEQLRGKELSYNNLLDLDAAWAVVRDLPPVGVSVIKHSNPCGAAYIDGGAPAEVFRRARATDPTSAFGGIVGCNVEVDEEMARALKELFLEAVVAPGFSESALAVLAKKKNLRVIRRVDGAPPPYSLRSAAGGLLVQQSDLAIESLAGARVASKRQPGKEELDDLDFAWRMCKHVKSNAIVIAKGRALVGVGAGQMSRVDSVIIAARKAEVPTDGAVLASDAFFPFRDGVDKAAEAGIRAIVQPGGSKRDDEVIAAADEHGMAMVFTGVRHFRH